MSICISINEIDWQLTKDVIQAASAIATLVGVVVAIIFGWLGLDTWRKQLRGGHDHTLALKMLVSLYKFRDEVRSARRPMFSVPDLSKSLSLRHENATSKKIDIEVLLHECDAIWGEELRQKTEVLLSLYEELLVDVEHYIYASNPNTTPDNLDMYIKFHGERSKVMLDNGSMESNDFNSRFSVALLEVEQYLKDKVAI